MKKRETILFVFTVVFTILALAALAFPVYVPKIDDGARSFTLADVTFGFEMDGAKIFEFFPVLFSAILSEIIGLLVAVVAFIPRMKCKQVLRIISFILFVYGMSIYFSSKGLYVTGVDAEIMGKLLSSYNYSYAASVAGFSALVAGACQFIECTVVYKAGKKEKINQ